MAVGDTEAVVMVAGRGVVMAAATAAPVASTAPGAGNHDVFL